MIARPLSAEEQDALAVRAARGDDAALAAALASVAGLIRWQVNRLAGTEREDREQAATLALIAALPRFDPARGTFRTFTANHVRWAVLNERAAERRRRRERVGLPGATGEGRERFDALADPNPADPHARAEGAELWERLEELPPRDAAAVRLWCEGVSRQAVAERLGVTPGRVWQLRDRGFRRLRAAARTPGRT